MASCTTTLIESAPASGPELAPEPEVTEDPDSWIIPSDTNCSGSDTSSDPDEDVRYHLKEMRIPNAESWAKRMWNAGYTSMEDLAAMNLDEVAAEVQMPSGVKRKLMKGLEDFNAGTLNPLPDGNLDDTAPQQTKQRFNWALFFGITATTVAIGGVVGLVVWSGAAAEAVAGARAAAVAIRASGIGSFLGAATNLVLAILSDCLDGDSEITMADRKKKKIRDVKAGDKILTYNKGKLRIKTVLEVKSGSSSNMYSINLKSIDGNKFTIKATGGHPFYVKENGWAVLDPAQSKFSNEVRKLCLGDCLIARDGGAAEIEGIEEISGLSSTYNLVINGPGTFFVNDILSHSGLPPPSK